MPRKPRWLQLVADAAFHVLSRGPNREALFADPQDLSPNLPRLLALTGDLRSGWVAGSEDQCSYHKSQVLNEQGVMDTCSPEH